MLDAFIIDFLERERKKPDGHQQPVLEIPLPPPEYAPPSSDEPPRGIIIIDDGEPATRQDAYSFR